ncbi:vesicle-associated membrane protein/synaptobrevin-binding protein-like [Haliotis cracherodii]|uniref:vesicle-associated membrane protein/synaptobrevin-binding protein-like n=1 Tax=Haliotis cracherodii TaxID=6455 RepID=UPI0039E907AA
MAKNEQVLILEPAGELRFKGPFTDVVTADLKLKNPSDKKVCFKVKTTAPKRYCVRPNSGIIEPGLAVTVAVMLQPFEYDPTEKNRHKFMVQTMFAPDSKVDSLEQLWKDVTPENLMDSKLKCVFDMPESAQQSSVADVEEKPKIVRPLETQAVKPAVSSSTDPELKKAMEECYKMQNEIGQLRDENSKLKDEGIRLRKVAIKDTVSSTPTSSSSSMSTQANPAMALPPVVYIIAAVILGFIIGKFIL